MAESEIDYARRRTAEELDRADRCSDPNAAHVHRRLAVLYANMVAELHQSDPASKLAEQADMPRVPRREMPMPHAVCPACAETSKSALFADAAWPRCRSTLRHQPNGARRFLAQARAQSRVGRAGMPWAEKPRPLATPSVSAAAPKRRLTIFSVRSTLWMLARGRMTSAPLPPARADQQAVAVERVAVAPPAEPARRDQHGDGDDARGADPRHDEQTGSRPGSGAARRGKVKPQA